MPAPICRSMSTTSTGSPRVCSRASSASAAAPSAASAATVMPSKSGQHGPRDRRGPRDGHRPAGRGFRSAAAPAERQPERHHGPFPGRGLDGEGAASAASRSRRAQPEAGSVRPARDRTRSKPWPSSKICPWSPPFRGSPRVTDGGAGGRVASDVGQAGLGGPQQGGLVGPGQLHGVPVTRAGRPGAFPARRPRPRRPGTEPAQAGRQRIAFQGGRLQRRGRSSGPRPGCRRGGPGRCAAGPRRGLYRPRPAPAPRERPISTMLEKPWARVSWISRASRARSASIPASCSAAGQLGAGAAEFLGDSPLLLGLDVERPVGQAGDDGEGGPEAGRRHHRKLRRRRPAAVCNQSAAITSAVLAAIAARLQPGAARAAAGRTTEGQPDEVGAAGDQQQPEQAHQRQPPGGRADAGRSARAGPRAASPGPFRPGRPRRGRRPGPAAARPRRCPGRRPAAAQPQPAGARAKPTCRLTRSTRRITAVPPPAGRPPASLSMSSA